MVTVPWPTSPQKNSEISTKIVDFSGYRKAGKFKKIEWVRGGPPYKCAKVQPDRLNGKNFLAKKLEIPLAPMVNRKSLDGGPSGVARGRQSQSRRGHDGGRKSLGRRRRSAGGDPLGRRRRRCHKTPHNVTSQRRGGRKTPHVTSHRLRRAARHFGPFPAS